MTIWTYFLRHFGPTDVGHFGPTSVGPKCPIILT